MREGREGREAEAKEESAVSKVEGRRGGSGGGTSGEERRFEKEEDGGFNLEGLGMGGKPSSLLTICELTLPAIRVTNWWQRRQNGVLQFQLLISSQLSCRKAEKAPPCPIR